MGCHFLLQGIFTIQGSNTGLPHCRQTLYHLSYQRSLALTIWTSIAKVMFRLFKTLSMFLIAFLPRRKTLLISWLQTLSIVILEPSKIKSATVSIFPSSICCELMEADASFFTFMHWRRKWQPIPVFLPGESQGQGSLVGCHLWGHTELDTTKAT